MEQKRTILVVGGPRSGKTEFIEGCKKMCGFIFDGDIVLNINYVEGRKDTIDSIFKFKVAPDGVVVMFSWKNHTHYAVDHHTTRTAYLDEWFRTIRERFGTLVPIALCGSHPSEAPMTVLLRNALCSFPRSWSSKSDKKGKRVDPCEVIGNKNAFSYEASYFSVESPECKGLTNVIKDLLL